MARRPAAPVAAPEHGEAFPDARGDGRTMRVTWHGDERLVVISLWRSGRCTATFRMPADDLPAFLTALTDGPLGR